MTNPVPAKPLFHLHVPKAKIGQFKSNECGLYCSVFPSLGTDFEETMCQLSPSEHTQPKKLLPVQSKKETILLMTYNLSNFKLIMLY